MGRERDLGGRAWWEVLGSFDDMIMGGSIIIAQGDSLLCYAFIHNCYTESPLRAQAMDAPNHTGLSKT